MPMSGSHMTVKLNGACGGGWCSSREKEEEGRRRGSPSPSERSDCIIALDDFHSDVRRLCRWNARCNHGLTCF